MSLGSMKFEVNSDTGFVTVGYGAGSSPTFTRVLVGNGTAAAPSYSFTNDSNTGFYIVPAAPDILYFTSAGTNSLRFSGVSGNGYVYSGASNANIGLLAAGGILLAADGTNQDITLQPTGAGRVRIKQSIVAPTYTNNYGLTINDAADTKNLSLGVASTYAFIQSFNTSPLAINPGGNAILIGKETNANNGSIQLLDHTTFNYGIAFGSDVTLYRTAANSLGIYTNSAHSFTFNQNGANSVFTFNTFPGIVVNCTRIQAQFGTDLFLGGFGGSNENTVLRVGGTGQVLLSSSTGPAISSAITGRGVRQALLFDGTRGVTIPTATCAFGTGNFTIAFIARRDTAAVQQFLLGNDVGQCLYIGFRTSGFLYSGQAGGSPNTDFDLKNVVGKEQHIVLTRSGTTLTCYSNGVSVGTVTDANNYSAGAVTLFAADVTGSAALLGSGSLQGVYNRALSATEVVALYESGLPAQADYGVSGSVPPGNTGLVGDAFTNFQYDTFTGATTSGFTAVETGGQACQATTGKTTGTYMGLAPAGTRYLVTFTATLTSGAVPVVAIGKSTVGLVSNLGVVANGANSHVLTLTAALTAENSANSGNLYFTSTGNTNYTISGFTVIRLGLLIAPSDSQSGGGLTWYDTSGNGRNITLPASSVSWNVPGNGTLAATGTNANVYLTPTGTGDVFVGGTVMRLNPTANSYSTFGQDCTLATYSAHSLVFVSNAAERARFVSGGNFLLGTFTDSSNGRLQLATHTTSAGGIGFGTDSSIFRQAGAMVAFTGTSAFATFKISDNGAASYATGVLSFGDGNSTARNVGVWRAASGSMGVAGNILNLGGYDGITFTVGPAQIGLQNIALTLGSDSNATFAGALITAASAAAKAGLRLPHGAAPTAPVNGDIWTTTAGLYVRINGVTVGPLT